MDFVYEDFIRCPAVNPWAQSASTGSARRLRAPPACYAHTLGAKEDLTSGFFYG